MCVWYHDFCLFCYVLVKVKLCPGKDFAFIPTTKGKATRAPVGWLMFMRWICKPTCIEIGRIVFEWEAWNWIFFFTLPASTSKAISSIATKLGMNVGYRVWIKPTENKGPHYCLLGSKLEKLALCDILICYNSKLMFSQVHYACQVSLDSDEGFLSYSHESRKWTPQILKGLLFGQKIRYLVQTHQAILWVGCEHRVQNPAWNLQKQASCEQVKKWGPL